MARIARPRFLLTGPFWPARRRGRTIARRSPPMKAVLKAAVLPALALAAAGCQVNVDENTAERIENAADRLENAAEGAAAKAENAAEGAAAQAGKAAEGAAATVGNAADRLDNVDVDVGVRADGNDAAANKQ
jgi:hypothetical protein